jgi:hypothetical protein
LSLSRATAISSAMKALLLFLLATALPALSGDANRLTYLDDTSPFWPTARSAKLVTPQWVGEDGVEAVVVIAIDDMREPAKYEAFLRPILERLKRIDGRAPVSIMTNTVTRGPTTRRVVARGAFARSPHAHASVSLPGEGRFWGSGQDVSRVRRSARERSREQAGGVSHAVLRFDELGQPALFQRGIQPHERAGPLARHRFVGLHALFAMRVSRSITRPNCVRR